MPRAELTGLFDMMRSMPKAHSIAEMRVGMEAMIPFANANPPAVARVEPGVAIGDGVRADVLVPPGTPPFPVLIYLHGGGWSIGSPASHHKLACQLCAGAGVLVVNVDYRLAPEHPFPAPLDDCVAAARWTRANIGRFGGDATRLAVGGDSAGGNLAAVVCQLAKQKGGPHLVFQLLIYPVTQYRANTESMKSFAEGYFLERRTMDWFFDQYTDAANVDPNDPRLSPLAASDLSGLPRAYVVTAGFDPLKDEGKAYADKLNRAGVAAVYVDYPSMIHGFFGMSAVLPQARQAIADASAALRKAFGD